MIMESNNWKKLENEDGYPCYIEETTGKQQYDHPEFLKILEKLKVHDGIKYVPALRISSGVFARHQLSLSESSLSLDTVELEAVLADIYFAAEKEGHFSGDVDLAVDLMINLLLNVHDRDRKEPIRVLAAKTLLIILSEESAASKWGALANCAADHNGCVSPKRLAALLTHVTALANYLGSSCTQLQQDVDACFEKNAGMLGLPARAVSAWGTNSSSTSWLPVLQRIMASRQHMGTATASCSNCHKPLTQMLKFQCMKCNEVYFCEKCYLYDTCCTVDGHKKTHLVQEIIDEQIKPPQCVSFMRGVKRFLFCSKTKKRKSVKLQRGRPREAPCRGKEAPTIYTSTVGKAGGHKETSPACVLHDIITHMETHYKALQELSARLKQTTSDDETVDKVEDHCTHISTQVNRLKAFKDNLSNQVDLPIESNPEKPDRPQAFDLFSPIAKQPKAVDTKQPCAPSPTGSTSPGCREPEDSQHLLTRSGDALRPVLHHAETISLVSLADISSWYQHSIGPPERVSASTTGGTESTAAGVAAREAGLRPERREASDAELDTALGRLHNILANNFADESSFDNSELRARARELEELLGALIRGVERRAGDR